MADVRDEAVVAQRGERRAAAWVACVFVASNVYYFHRYVFRYSSSQTSPTYVDTPMLWQSGKFVLMLVATVAAWLSVWWAVGASSGRGRPLWRRLEVRPTGGFAPVVASFVVYGVLLTAALAPSTSDAGDLGDVVGTWFFLPLVLVTVVVALGRPSLVVYGWAGAALVVYHVVFSLAQLVLFLVVDRLPALAYRDGLTRFGGGLDDPNGFGVLVSLGLLIGVATWSSWSGQRGVRLAGLAVLIVLVGLLFLTLSFSAAIGALAGFVALALITGRTKLLAGLGVTVVVGGAIGATWGYTRGVVSDKMRSASSRFDFGGSGDAPGIADFVRDAGVVDVLFGDAGAGYFSENSYLLVLTDFGLVGVALVVAAGTIALYRGMVTIRNARASDALGVAHLYEGIVAFLVAFAVASLGVPYFSVFPVNMAFWIAATLAAMGPNISVRGDGNPAEPGSA